MNFLKKINLLYVLLIVSTVNCNNHDLSPEGNYNEEPFNIEGQWYISGRTVDGYRSNDSIRYNYNEFIYGYEEFSFQQVQGEENFYSVLFRMRTIKQKEDESIVDYTDRITTGNYSSDELFMSNEFYEWGNIFISGNDLYIPWDGKKYKGVLFAKIVNKSYNQFTIASTCYDISSIAWDDPLTYKYYITFTRIK